MSRPIIPLARKIVMVVAITLTAGLLITACAIFLLDQSNRLHTRTTNERQYRVNAEWWDNDLTTIRKFEKRHGLSPETKGGLRLTIGEWPDWKYLISIETLADGSAKGAINAVAYDGKGPVYEEDFLLDKYEAKPFFDLFDQKIDGYWGATTVCLDGTGFQLERWDDKAVSSGSGNAACHHHYAELMSLVAETLIVRLNKVPFDWRTWLTAKRYLELRGDVS